MVNVNGETSYTWSEEEGFHGYSYTRECENVGYQGKGIGNQQERVNRAYSAELSYFDTRGESVDPRAAAPGGTITQLIEDTEHQIAESEAHALKLRNHLQKLYMLRNQLGEPE
jgi:hypothetical protein